MRSLTPMLHAGRFLRTALHTHGKCFSLLIVFAGGIMPSICASADDAPATLAQGSCPPNWPSCASGENLFDSNTRGSGWSGFQQRPKERPEPRPRKRAKAKDGANDGATYRTFCVRMCDGYYWPLSFATTRQHFKKDASQCATMCSAEVKLYVHRNPGETPDDMVDLDGGKYADLPNAHLYRSTLTDACSCKPPPWSEQERLRHASYSGKDSKSVEAVTRVMERRAAMAAMAAALGSDVLSAVNERLVLERATR